MKLRLQKTRLHKAQEDVEARRQNFPPIVTSLHSSLLAAPLLISLYTIHNVNDTVQSDTSGDEIVISSPSTPEPEASLETVLDQIISAPRLQAEPLTHPTIVPDYTPALAAPVVTSSFDPESWHFRFHTCQCNIFTIKQTLIGNRFVYPRVYEALTLMGRCWRILRPRILAFAN